MTVAAAVCLAAIASAPLAVTSLGSQGIAVPGLQSAQQLMAMLDARSPGEREKGELAQTKIKKRLASVPRERALGKTFPPKPSPVEQLANVVVPVPPPVPTVPPIAPLIPPTASDIINPATFIASAPPFGGGPSIIGGGGGGIGGGGSPPPSSGTPPTSEVPPGGTVVSPVPEPGTWLTMLLGFGMIGSAMGRRRRTRARVAVA
ncbi:PEPxxWA-CTERM sorting domain-containing protein [Sphingomonas glaciei]|uniref:PEPxxWA-CTERM sorting domain-containing protein n=1 Tax=Sphingomonas glaciei TaxID=2938948 RepID=A0ABY5MR39_9SPHN|nr:PEPxxWA-CTERM sorting domain-containing protein [Sphingomonas glaciei]UUR06950.1 PEPxxWA-CTERM sorting domain-containing protein [Sphingomonas glaciei]